MGDKALVPGNIYFTVALYGSRGYSLAVGTGLRLCRAYAEGDRGCLCLLENIFDLLLGAERHDILDSEEVAHQRNGAAKSAHFLNEHQVRHCVDRRTADLLRKAEKMKSTFHHLLIPLLGELPLFVTLFPVLVRKFLHHLAEGFKQQFLLFCAFKTIHIFLLTCFCVGFTYHDNIRV